MVQPGSPGAGGIWLPVKKLTFVPVKAKPREIPEHSLLRLPRGPLHVRVLYSEDEAPAVGPVERSNARRDTRELKGRASGSTASKVVSRDPKIYAGWKTSRMEPRADGASTYLAKSQLKSAVRAPPTCRFPVGDGAKRTLISDEPGAALAAPCEEARVLCAWNPCARREELRTAAEHGSLPKLGATDEGPADRQLADKRRSCPRANLAGGCSRGPCRPDGSHG